MKKVDHVHVKNFKSLKDVSIKLGNLTLITGVNSSGKSTFIQSLLLLKENDRNIQNFWMLRALMNEKSNKEFSEYAARELKQISLTLHGEYIDLGETKSILYQEAFNENISIEVQGENESGLTLKFDVDSKFEVSRKESDVNWNFLERLYYVSTDRTVPSITYPLSEQHVNKGEIGLNGQYAAHYLSHNRHSTLNISQLKHAHSTTSQLLENVSKWLGEISSGINVDITIHDDLQVASLKYQYTYGENTTAKYTPLNVGFGITYVLPIIVAILKSKSGDLLIIENPESHLHPAGQSKLAELCAIAASCGVQVIVETHSDHFLNGVRVATKKAVLSPEESQIYYFEKAKDSMETIAHPLNIDSDGRIDEWPEGFFDEWDNKLNELLW